MSFLLIIIFQINSDLVGLQKESGLFVFFVFFNGYLQEDQQLQRHHHYHEHPEKLRSCDYFKLIHYLYITKCNLCTVEDRL